MVSIDQQEVIQRDQVTCPGSKQLLSVKAETGIHTSLNPVRRPIVTLKYRQVLALKPLQTILCHWFWGADKPERPPRPGLTEEAGCAVPRWQHLPEPAAQSPVIQEAHLAVPALRHLRGQRQQVVSGWAPSSSLPFLYMWCAWPKNAMSCSNHQFRSS